MTRGTLVLSVAVALTLGAVGCSDDSGEETTAAEESETAAAETETTASAETETGDPEGCEPMFVAVATGLDAQGGNRPCAIAYGTETSVDSTALAQCGGDMSCYVQLPATPGYCGVMVMSPDAEQFWPGVTEECTTENLEAMLLEQCKTAAGGTDCMVRCSQCGLP